MFVVVDRKTGEQASGQQSLKQSHSKHTLIQHLSVGKCVYVCQWMGK